MVNRGNSLSLPALCLWGWGRSGTSESILDQPLRSGLASTASPVPVNAAVLWAEVTRGLRGDTRGLSRLRSAHVTWTGNDNEGDLTRNTASKVPRDLYMMLLSQCSLELLLVPPTLIHSHGAWPRKDLVHVSSDTILKINKNEWKIAEEVIF